MSQQSQQWCHRGTDSLLFESDRHTYTCLTVACDSHDMQVSEEELAQYIASQQQAGHTLPGITLSRSKPQVSCAVLQHTPAALHWSIVLLRSTTR